jgi:hypothetical protein
MKKFLYLIFIPLMLGGCGFNQSPQWITNTNRDLENYKSDFLSGEDSRITDKRFRNAIEEIKKSGDIDLLAKAWLTRMAMQGAVLEEMEDSGYKEISDVKKYPDNEQYYLFLKGNASGVEGKALPKQYKKFIEALKTGDLPKVEKAITAMEDDPVSQMIASGVAIRSHIERETILQTAVDTASHNGWKRALLAWLKRLETFYQEAGNSAKATETRQRINLIEK